MNNLVTIFTPTYNRAHLLPRLYESLCMQNSLDFLWFVIDDGSTDDTMELIEGYIAEAKINIEFTKIPNGGKHRAINRAVNECCSKLFFIVDSDDYLDANATVLIEQLWSGTPNKQECAGLCFRRATIEGKIIGIPFVKDSGIEASMFDITYKHNINVDRSEVFRTDILKQFPFDTIEGENFLPEAIVWNRISRSKVNKLICSNTPIYYCEYQEGGLTRSFMKILKKNPKGLMRYYSELLCTPSVYLYPIVVAKAAIRWSQTLFYRLMG